MTATIAGAWVHNLWLSRRLDLKRTLLKSVRSRKWVCRMLELAVAPAFSSCRKVFETCSKQSFCVKLLEDLKRGDIHQRENRLLLPDINILCVSTPLTVPAEKCFLLIYTQPYNSNRGNVIVSAIRQAATEQQSQQIKCSGRREIREKICFMYIGWKWSVQKLARHKNCWVTRMLTSNLGKKPLFQNSRRLPGLPKRGRLLDVPLFLSHSLE